MGGGTLNIHSCGLYMQDNTPIVEGSGEVVVYYSVMFYCFHPGGRSARRMQKELQSNSFPDTYIDQNIIHQIIQSE